MAAVGTRRIEPKFDRIPEALQRVFILSNKGKEVNKPPPNRVASRVFFRAKSANNIKLDSQTAPVPTVSLYVFFFDQ
jgi:hypothetical protein